MIKITLKKDKQNYGNLPVIFVFPFLNWYRPYLFVYVIDFCLALRKTKIAHYLMYRKTIIACRFSIDIKKLFLT